MEESTNTECLSLLAQHHLGRLALVDAPGPVIFPFNYVFDQGWVVFWTDPGTKLDAAAAPVAFEVDAVDEATRTGWSVVVGGALVEVWDPEDLERLRALPLSPWAPGEKAISCAAADLGDRPPHRHPGPLALHLVGLRFGTGRAGRGPDLA